MSKSSGGRVAVDVNAIYAQIQALAEEINRLQSVEAQLAMAIESVRRAKDSIDAFVTLGKGAEVLVPLDNQLNGYGRVSVADPDKFIVALGLGYYAEVDAAKALELLGSRERSLLDQLGRLRETLSEYTRLYNQYRQVLSAVLAASARGGGEG